MADNDTFYRFLKKVAIGPAIEVGFHPWVDGLENIPATGCAILASNHLSFSDSIFLPIAVPRKITFLAKAEYFQAPGIKGKAMAAFFKGAGQVPVDRTGGNAGTAAIRTGVRLLNEGHLLGIYPEGTRSPDGRLYRGKTGVARMALEARVPVIPAALINTDKVQPVGRSRPNFGVDVGIRIGKPLDFSRYYGMEDDRFVLRSLTDEIMYKIMDLSGQEYVDMYASRAKSLSGE
ncbi:MAG: 1-acyl-sn-glycerol-3-phosphate acyltransferase [Actinobacteria bacterium]|nr:1-acyl-sn-glycerol-3-phosphate acyltransferase [Actinomycetota bacterium]